MRAAGGEDANGFDAGLCRVAEDVVDEGCSVWKSHGAELREGKYIVSYATGLQCIMGLTHRSTLKRKNGVRDLLVPWGQDGLGRRVGGTEI